MQSVSSQGHLISCFKDIAPHGLRGEEALLVSGLRQDKYGAISFRPKQEHQRLFSSLTLTDEPLEQKLGGVALDNLGTSLRVF